MYTPKKVNICEVGLRDGLQNEKSLLTTDQKVELLQGLIDAGFKVIEVGSFMHPVKVPQMADTDEVIKRMGEVEGVELRCLIPNLRGVERAVKCGCKKVKLNVSASRMHNLKNLNRTPEESVAKFAEVCEAATAAGIAISGSISMPFASPWEGVTPVEDVDSIIEAYGKVGIHEVSLSDASGMATPAQVAALCSHVQEKFPENTWWLHFHNTRGLAMANIVAAMDVGMTQFDSSFGGLGGCPFVPNAAGNISTEDVLHMCEASGIETGVDLPKVMELTRKMQEMLAKDRLESYVMKAGRNADLIAQMSEKE